MWIRATGSAVCGWNERGTAQVFAAGRAYGSALRAMSAEARRLGLILRVESGRTRAGLTTSQITLFLGKDRVCGLRLLNVSRIARAAIVMDDLGRDLGSARVLLSLHAPLTFSVMPGQRDSRQLAEAAHRAGVEVMLHLPMQPIDDSAPDISPHELRVGMSDREVERLVLHDLATVPDAAGVNNHMGSRATADGKLMAEVMSVLAKRRLYFIDSRTSPDSVALAAARRAGLRAFYRSVFLDDVRTVRYTLGQLRLLSRLAQERGAVLAIGHPYPSTLAALRLFLPELYREDVQLVPVSQLLRSPEVARLSPPRSPSGLSGNTGRRRDYLAPARANF